MNNFDVIKSAYKNNEVIKALSTAENLLTQGDECTKEAERMYFYKYVIQALFGAILICDEDVTPLRDFLENVKEYTIQKLAEVRHGQQ